MSSQAQALHLDKSLREDVRLLGQLLGKVIAKDRGQRFLEEIETIRSLAKRARSGGAAEWNELSDYLQDIHAGEIVDVARAFNQFLNLANIAEQHHEIRKRGESQAADWTALFSRLTDRGIDQDAIVGTLTDLRIDLVLTAHPTEILRRTQMLKYDAIADELRHWDRSIKHEEDRHKALLHRLIAEAWHTDEIRQERPTPQEEAKWGFAVIENALWEALPAFMRELDQALENAGLPELPIRSRPIRFASWMGGDRDGNPNVTAQVTREVLMLARWMGADLFLRDVERLLDSLSMEECSGDLRKKVGKGHEPYRVLLRQVRDKLTNTRTWSEALDPTLPSECDSLLLTTEELMDPLLLCYDSLVETGMSVIAEGPLLDTIRRIGCFGINLVDLDIRQNADRHTRVLDELTRHLDIHIEGTYYRKWSDIERRDFLLKELSNPRPLLPVQWEVSDESQEVLDTFSVIAEQKGAGISQYIISMANSPNDVLAVALLLQASGITRKLPIVPLFETLADLKSCAQTIDDLLAIPWYRDYTEDHQQIMIGYAHSAKDAGQLAASWTQYQAKEALHKVATKHQFKLTIFHGRGSPVGRGGQISYDAIVAQPPGSVSGSIRVAEQGELVRFKLGLPGLAQATMSRYFQGTIEATLAPAPGPEPYMREKMSEMAEMALASFRRVVQEDEHFAEFFRDLTPEEELVTLALGSRPGSPEASNDLESLRAIPWIFAWNQVRVMLPAWLGTDTVLHHALDGEGRTELDKMMQWLFFSTQMNLLELALAKTDVNLAKYYAARLTHTSQHERCQNLCGKLTVLIQDLLTIKGEKELLESEPERMDSIRIRNTYLDPLHLLQAELVARFRSGDSNNRSVEQALRVTMAGIASGLRNTG